MHAAVAARGVGEGWIRFLCVLDELGECLHGKGRIDGQHEHVRGHARHRRQVAPHIDRHALIYVRIDHEDAVLSQQQSVAIGRRLRDQLGGDVAVCARVVLHHDCLSERMSQFFGEDTRHHIRRAARRNGDDHADGLGRIFCGQSARCGQRKQGQQPAQKTQSDFHDAQTLTVLCTSCGNNSSGVNLRWQTPCS